MSWSLLRSHLQQLRDAGDGSFEDIVRQLLSWTTGEICYLAGRGLQPSGDVINNRGTVSIQAKRYKETTSLDHAQIIGDFYRVYTHEPSLEVYVLAAPRSIPAQLRDKLNAIERETCVDIVTLGLEDGNPSLGILCGAHWSRLSQSTFFLNADLQLTKWLSDMAVSEVNKQDYERLATTVSKRLRTWQSIKESALSIIYRRFGLIDNGTIRNSYTISLQDSIKRKDLGKAVKCWWESSTQVGVVRGEEGTGKSWGSAQVVLEIANQGIFVLWMDSIRWCNAKSIDEIIYDALLSVTTLDRRAIELLIHKFYRRFDRPFLLVLDGANEHEAESHVNRLLTSIASDKRYVNLRLLITSRPIPGDRHLWRGCEVIDHFGFSDSELTEALARHGSIRIDDLEPGLLPLLRLPRYFNRCFELRNRFGRILEISKELLVWEDLKSRIELWDPQLRDRLGLQNTMSASRALQSLAKRVRSSIGKSCNFVDSSVLIDCFSGKATDPLRDLEELRVVNISDGEGVRLNPTHAILGWALSLDGILSTTTGVGVAKKADIIRRLLEPIPEEDLRTEAVFVAYQLAVASGKNDSDAFSSRAGLLYVWYCSHNAISIERRLQCIGIADINSYIPFIEFLYEDIPVSLREEYLIYPLASIWVGRGSGAVNLQGILKRWLLLTWRFDQVSGTKTIHYKGHHLPSAATNHQLRLTSIALSIVSLRPVYELLPVLALGYATMTASIKDNGGKSWPTKIVDRNYIQLMRWGYTEACLGELTKLAKACEDEVVLEGYRRLTACLGILDPPAVLALPVTNRPKLFHLTSTLEAIRQRGSPFDSDNGFRHGWFIDAAPLAVREDLPRLTESAIATIREVVNSFRDNSMSDAAERGQSLRELDAAMPWVAKIEPEVVRTSLLGVFRSPNILNNFEVLNALSHACFTNSDQDQAIVLTGCEEFLINYMADPPKESLRYPLHLLYVTEILLLNCSTQQCVNWLYKLSQNSFSRKVVDSMTFCVMLKALRRQEFTRVFKLECKNAYQRCSYQPIDEYIELLEYWSSLWALSVFPEEDDYDWVKEVLTKNEIPLDKVSETLMLLAALADPKRFAYDLFSQESLQQRMSRRVERRLALHAPEYLTHLPVEIQYDELMRLMQCDHAGAIFAFMGRDKDVDRWGREILSIATDLTTSESPPSCSRVGTVFHLSDQGIVSKGPRTGGRMEALHLATPTAWGIDINDGYDNINISTSIQSFYEKEIDSWQQDSKIVERWVGFPFHAFEGERTLVEWAKKNPQAFRSAAEKYLKAISSQSTLSFHMAMFTYAIRQGLLQILPVEELTYFNDAFLDSSFVVNDQYGVEGFTGTIWRERGSSDNVYLDLQRKQLENSEDDEALMRISIAVIAGGTEKKLRGFIDEFLRSNKACIRNLAVSLLPWFGTNADVKTLIGLRDNDPNKWVRDHATWAAEVALAEISCRNLYAESLKLTNAVEFSSRLQVLEPALSPTCRWWRYTIPRELNIKCSPQIDALLKCFWQHWDGLSSHNRDIRVYGRKLTDWCRGHEKDSFVSPRMAPWWQI